MSEPGPFELTSSVLGGLAVVNHFWHRLRLDELLAARTCPWTMLASSWPRRPRSGWWSPTCWWAGNRSTGWVSGRPGSPRACSGWATMRPRVSELTGLRNSDAVLGTGAHLNCTGKTCARTRSLTAPLSCISTQWPPP